MVPLWFTLWRWRRAQERLKALLVDVDDVPWALSQLTAQEGQRVMRRVGGLDISFFGGDDDRACVALVVCELDDAQEDLKLVWKDFSIVRMTQPYVAGFLAFREASHYHEILDRLAKAAPEMLPDAILVDGNGVLHPRGFGVASHIGVLSGYCTIGVAKDLHLVDGLDRDSAKQKCQATPGNYAPLVGQSGRVWGAALLPVPRRPAGPKNVVAAPKNPIYISIGHRLSLETSVEVVKLCMLSARVPEPVRLADVLSREQVRFIKESEGKDNALQDRRLPPWWVRLFGVSREVDAAPWIYACLVALGGFAALAVASWCKQDTGGWRCLASRRLRRR